MKYLFFFLYTLTCFAQHPVSGLVSDESSGKPIEFAVIKSDGKVLVTDAEGKFGLESVAKVVFSAPGYQSKQVALQNGFTAVTLKKSSDEISLREEQAREIVAQAIRKKSENDPQRRLTSFEFKTYNKLLVTAEPDSVTGKIDTIRPKRPRWQKMKIDSSNYQFKQLMRRQHLFLSEKVSHFQYDGTALKETVTATKMAGFRQPVYEILAFRLQSFSLYDESYELLETKYSSPLAKNALEDYRYRILDTAKLEGRPIIVIHFKQKRSSRKSGLEGVLFIDSESFGIARAVFRTKAVLDITGVHDFSFLPEQSIWFPSSRSIRIVKGHNDVDVRILGETIRFDALTDQPGRRKKEASDYTYIISESVNSAIIINQPLAIKKSQVAIEIKDEALQRTEDFWNRFRTSPITKRELNTYSALDSIVEKRRYEKKLRLGRKIINGYVPFGPVDLDLRYLLSYNNYEGFRLGLGGITNERFSEKYRLEGYTAYGTKDHDMKFSVGAAARIGKFSATWVGGSYTDDVREIASTSFAIDKRVFKIYDPRPINVSTFYNHRTERLYLQTRFIPNTESIWQLTQSRIEPLFNYRFLHQGKLFHVYDMSTAMVSLQWNPLSRYMQTPSGRIEAEKRFPKFTFQFTQSLPGILNNDFEFAKADFRAEYERKYLNGQKSAFLLEAGYAYGDVPLTHLYNTSPNNLTKDRLLQRITIAGKDAFETMYFNEFFSSQYVMLQMKHGSRRVTILRKVRPSLVFVTRMAWGTMENDGKHFGIEYKTLEKGYFESGIELNQIYQGFGISGFYRYGPNQLSRLEDNLTIKISFILNVGI